MSDCIPEWADSTKELSNSIDTRRWENFLACLYHADRIILKQAESGRYFAHIYLPGQDIAIARSRNDFNDLIIAIQEVVLP
jgi:hypothetical protein